MRTQLGPMTVLSVKAVGGTKGASAAFDFLESKLPTLKGRRFYGIFNPFTDEYRACVVKAEGENAAKMGLEEWTISGGAYASRKVADWPSKVADFPRLFMEMAANNTVDRTRPSVEFYRSHKEAVLYLPVV